MPHALSPSHALSSVLRRSSPASAFLVQKAFVRQVACRLLAVADVGKPFVVVGNLFYCQVPFFDGEAHPFPAGAAYAPLGQEGDVVVALPEAVEQFVPAVVCVGTAGEEVHDVDMGEAVVYAVLYQFQLLQAQEEAAHAAPVPAEEACPSVETLYGVATGAGYGIPIQGHAAVVVVDVGDENAVGLCFAGRMFSIHSVELFVRIA